MYIQRLASRCDVVASSVPRGPPDDPVFMFGTFDQEDKGGADASLALNEALLGIREGDRPLAIPRRCHRGALAHHTSSAFMFGVHPEQPSCAPVAELPLCLWASDLD